MNGLNVSRNTVGDDNKNKINIEEEIKNKINGANKKSLQLDLNDNMTDFNAELFNKIERENIDNANISFDKIENNGSTVQEVPKILSPIVIC